MAQPLSDIEEYIQFGTPGTTEQDCNFLQDLMRRQQKEMPRLLDLACGLGRHALEMAKRGFDTTGIDLSAERIKYAQNEVQESGLSNCRFFVADIHDLPMQSEFDYAYSFFNTFSLFIDNDDLIRILGSIRSCLADDGRLVVHLGSLWSWIAEGKFLNDSYEQTYDRGSLVRKEKGTTRISRVNNVYRHDRIVQYIRDGKEYPPEEVPMVQRAFSINEWDLLCRLTDFRIEHVFSSMDVSHEVTDYTTCEGNAEDHALVLVLAK